MIHELIVKKIKERGLWGTLRLIVRRLFSVLDPSYRRYLRDMAEEVRFDRIHGTDTIGIVEVDGITDVNSDNLKFAVRYEPTSINTFKSVISDLSVAEGLDRYVFIDFGSGKGLTLMLASDYPFKRIVGVEFSPHIMSIAHRNLAAYRSETQRCVNIELVCTDACDFAIPDDPTVFYFYNPFEDPVMRRVLSNIEASLLKSPRKVHLVYVNPVCEHLLQAASYLRPLKRRNAYVIYESK